VPSFPIGIGRAELITGCIGHGKPRKEAHFTAAFGVDLVIKRQEWDVDYR